MEFSKQNLMMEYEKEAVTEEFSVETDVFVNDSHNEVGRILAKNVYVRQEEANVENGRIEVNGTLVYQILCESVNFGRLFCLSGELPVSEQIQTASGEKGDEISVNFDVEDLTVLIINPSKLGLKALIRVRCKVKNLVGKEVLVEIYGKDDTVEMRKDQMNFLKIIASKKDVVRIRQELTLGSQYQAVDQILWHQSELKTLECQTKEGAIHLSGEMGLFLVYETDHEEAAPVFYETVVPFQGVLDCSGVKDAMIVDTDVLYIEEHVECKEDFDGEERILHVEFTFHVAIHVYEEVETNVIEDLYGTRMEITLHYDELKYQRCLYSGDMKKKISERTSLEKRYQLLPGTPVHTQAKPFIDTIRKTEEGISIQGVISLKLLCQEQKEGMPYIGVESQIPFSHLIPVKNMEHDCATEVCIEVEQILVQVRSDAEIEVRALLNFRALAIATYKRAILTEVQEALPDPKKMEALPSMCIYYAKERETLWQIGKKYYLPVSRIREQNHLTRDYLHQGERILIFR